MSFRRALCFLVRKIVRAQVEALARNNVTAYGDRLVFFFGNDFSHLRERLPRKGLAFMLQSRSRHFVKVACSKPFESFVRRGFPPLGGLIGIAT